LVAENTWIQPGHDFTVGLHFSLENDWHTYWVNPGDSGQPARVTWELPPEITSGPIQWPAPEQLGSSAIVDYGYKREVTLLVSMRVSTDLPTDRPVMITAKVNVLVCKEVCIPSKTQVTLSLPAKKQTPPRDEAQKALFAEARARLPKQPPADWKFSAKDQGDSFIVSATVGKRVAKAYFYPLEESQIKNVAVQPITPESAGFRLDLPKSDQLTKPVARLKGVLRVGDGGAYAVDFAVPHSGSSKAPAARPAG
jgi:DsbC/DsbD-like thiol-disulfide interchange protein